MLIFSVIVISYIFLGYPFILWVLSCVQRKVVQKNEIYPRVSLIISAYNESAIIEKKIHNTIALTYPRNKLEIIVASESTDETNEIVRRYESDGISLDAYQGRKGKRATLYKAVPKATGEIIVFSDANAMYKADAIEKLVRNFSDERIGCVSGQLRYKKEENSFVGSHESTYWSFELILKKCASKLFSLAGCGGVNGSIFAIRKELYNPIDKFRGDDFEISCRIELDGWGVVMESEAISYEDVCETTKQEFQRKVRMASWNFRSAWLLFLEAIKKNRAMTVFLIVSHRLLRYTTPIWIIFFFVGNAFNLSGFWVYIFFMQVAFYILSLWGYLSERMGLYVPRYLLLPAYFCMINYAALCALWKNITNSTEQLWEKTR